ncbi:chitinase 2-like [Cynara cardunculus var. scolymus]|uniref:2S globulin n=1 Tax=Cynara cardunculus var. scolymus TaxID=59895 RepID=A0A103XPK0_CYNCS|nr:chitinase 2-like [Cynara cardunculus var. scolymus]KVH94576.1 2S globulin [Cynara cardunculus var. scolymus]
MSFLKLFFALIILHAHGAQMLTRAAVFREYIGANFKNVRFSDVPVNPNIDVHFILSFAIDYTTGSSPSPTNGRFNVFWDDENLSPSQVLSIKRQHSNVKVALSLGGDSVEGRHAVFTASSIDSWVSNAVSSLTRVIKQYHLDGIDIDYEHFEGASPNTFAQCVGRLVTILKNNRVISFASIAPYDDGEVQRHYLALWRSYGRVFDYVNFQFYAYDKGTTVAQFLSYFNTQASNYNGGKLLVSFSTDTSGGLKPYNGFFTACEKLRSQRKLNGIFVWSADDSKAGGFKYERQSQALLAKPQ